MNQEHIKSYQEKLQKLEASSANLDDNIAVLLSIFNRIFEDLTEHLDIQLHTLFTKMAHIANTYSVDRKLMYHLHDFRKYGEDNRLSRSDDSHYLSKGIAAIELLLGSLHNDKDLGKKLAHFHQKFPIPQKEGVKKFIGQLKIFVQKINTEFKTITASMAESPYDEITVRYDIPHKNDLFTSEIEYISRLNFLPITCQIHHVSINHNNEYIPEIFVFDPDYLIDVTTIAECFLPDGIETRFSILRKFLPSPSSKHLLIGNIANFFLDEIMINPKIEYSDIEQSIFRLDPEYFTLLDNESIMEILSRSKLHFQNLKKVINRDLGKLGINKNNSYIEPSFYAPSYGIQGRLDLFYQNTSQKKSSIVELKSGKAFRPNMYGLGNNHYCQTLLYDMMIKSVFGSYQNINNYILYSGEEDQHLRYAPSVKSQQSEAMHVRNKIWIAEKRLEHLTDDDPNVLAHLQVSDFDKIYGFHKRDIESFESIYQNMSVIMKHYFDHFVGFVMRERRLSKIGHLSTISNMGLASLWNQNLDEKKEQFNIINELEILKNRSDQNPPTIVLSYSAATSRLSNFRRGDTAVLYPDQGHKQDVLRSQVFKISILELTDQLVTVRLRSPQYNHEIFRKYKKWHIEHDTLDGSYNAMMRSLFSFASQSPYKQKLWLGSIAPSKTLASKTIPTYPELTEEQNQVLSNIINAEDYYLLWGPPGTGKTSVIIKTLVDYLYENTKENILLLAYTNRAVDEICSAISAISDQLKNKFVRIGSRHATHPTFQKNMLNEQISLTSNRKQIRDLFENHRIFVGTISSILNKKNLFLLKSFDRVIIDEASQILEPYLVGLLPMFPQALLIGDHRQLPAIVQQKPSHTKISNPTLKEIGLVDMRDSLFERLYKRCVKMQWNHTFGTLGQQGRMHQELLEFPNRHFYDNKISSLKKLARLTADFSQKSNRHQANSSNWLDERKIFVNSPKDESSFNLKVNQHEADIVISLVKSILENEKSNKYESSIGIITPFRAQIAQIKTRLEDNQLWNDQLSVDTVERYQGNARDIIIVSFCINEIHQLKSLINLSNEGIDRKLNVAITRVKEQLILIGNSSILNTNATYAALLETCKSVKATSLDLS